ncbi:MAG TPA: hypothetical protein GX716_06025 [Firmicutes bacterium]|nr:hypothetical protein [Candidatus Fermentithermobacillaceae bacterium]
MYQVLIVPEFWSDEIREYLDAIGQLFYIGIWSCCERSGVFEVKFGELRRKIFPGNPSITNKQLETYYQILREHKKIIEYKAQGRTLGWVKAYLKIQRRLQNVPPPILPLPDWVAYMDFNEPGEQSRDKYKYVVLPYDFTVDPPERPSDLEIVAYLDRQRAEIVKRRRKKKGGGDLDG